MTDRIEFKIEGVNSLVAKLESVSYEVGYKGGRFALRKAANLVRDDAKRRAERIDDPKTANSIAANIAVRWDGKRYRRTGDLKFRVGVLGGEYTYVDSSVNRRYGRAGQRYRRSGSKSNPGGDTFYWPFVEFGTERSRAQPFMRPALSENVLQATDEFSTHLVKSIDRAIKRQAKITRD